MGRTATDYSNMIKRKEGDIVRLTADLDALKAERSQSSKEIIALRGHIDTLTAELQAHQDDKERDAVMQGKLHEELDELRALMEAKTSEDERRTQVEKRKDEELVDLRAQTTNLLAELGELRRSTLEAQNRMKVALETSTKEHQSLLSSHRSLSDRMQATESKFKKADASLQDAEKAKRSLESELQALRSRQNDLEGELAETQRAKEVGGGSCPLDSLLIHARNCFCRVWNVNYPQLRPSTKTSKTLPFNSSGRRMLRTDNLKPSRSSLKPRPLNAPSSRSLHPVRSKRSFS